MHAQDGRVAGADVECLFREPWQAPYRICHTGVRHVQAVKEGGSVDNGESFQVVVGLDGSDGSRAALG